MSPKWSSRARLKECVTIEFTLRVSFHQQCLVRSYCAICRNEGKSHVDAVGPDQRAIIIRQGLIMNRSTCQYCIESIRWDMAPVEVRGAMFKICMFSRYRRLRCIVEYKEHEQNLIVHPLRAARMLFETGLCKSLIFFFQCL